MARDRRQTRPHRTEREIAALLLISMAAAIGLSVVYWTGGQTQLEGLFLLVSLGCLSIALVLWAHRLLPNKEESEPLPKLGPDDRELIAVAEELDRDDVLHRRPLLRRLLLGTGAALGIAALFPIRSLGPRPRGALKSTPWARGVRVVDDSGRPVRAADVPRGGLVTVFPEGHTDAADAVAVLIRVDEDRLDIPPGRETWSPEGLIVYSKVCTHAGCPVGLYLNETHELLCPCHQSLFDVLEHARPTAGPAARALPQLPIEIDASGVLVATGDFSDPVGPSWWTM